MTHRNQGMPWTHDFCFCFLNMLFKTKDEREGKQPALIHRNGHSKLQLAGIILDTWLIISVPWVLHMLCPTSF